MWEWYLELQSTENLTYLEIQSWAYLNQIKMHPWEIKLLRKLYDRGREWWRERSKKESR